MIFTTGYFVGFISYTPFLIIHSYFVVPKNGVQVKREKAFKKIGTKEEQRKLIQEWLEKDIKIKRLEYCRALHAEENAILQTSKIGGMGIKDGTIYTTAFPCELCAKKIYQAGIKEIIYTEPYPESISQEVFLKDGIKKIKLTQFEGVKSHSYYRLYKASMDKKEIQQLKKWVSNN